MKPEIQVASHYTRGKLEEAILAGVRAAGKDSGTLTAADLAPLDEFHVGGLEATQFLAKAMRLRPGMRLLDVGCGIGGPARYFAGEQKCVVSGIDLTEEFVSTAQSLTKLAGLDGQAEFHRASALELPFEAGSFDGAYMIHVGMNLPDKLSVFREVARVLKPAARFTIFDLMFAKKEPLRFPVPWAMTEETSFVSDVPAYRTALEQAGFSVEKEISHRTFAIEFTQRFAARVAAGSAPALGLHILMGEKTAAMLKNVLGAMVDGVLDPMELVARKG
jgi:ubiquinone/menaquinone biosynthesis C-methylase UbiE